MPLFICEINSRLIFTMRALCSNIHSSTNETGAQMSKFNEWQQAKSKLNEAKSWVKNKENIHRTGGKYSLRINTGGEFLQYCGQASEGANNYHSASRDFNSAVEQAIKNNYEMIFSDAIGLMEAKERGLAKSSKSEVEAMLLEIGDSE